MEEYFDVLDENGNLNGIKKLRSEVHRDGDWLILLINKKFIIEENFMQYTFILLFLFPFYILNLFYFLQNIFLI